MSETVEWIAGVTAILGAWMIAFPLLFTDRIGTVTEFAFWNYLLVGAGIFLLSVYDWYAADAYEPGHKWTAIVTVLLSLWLIAVPFFTEVPAESMELWNGMIVGSLVAVFAGYDAYQAANYEPEGTEQAA